MQDMIMIIPSEIKTRAAMAMAMLMWSLVVEKYIGPIPKNAQILGLGTFGARKKMEEVDHYRLLSQQHSFACWDLERIP